jgi:hypothetical protein
MNNDDLTDVLDGVEDYGLEPDDWARHLYRNLCISVLQWNGWPEPAQWGATYAHYSELRHELGQTITDAWALAKQGDAYWRELRLFGVERDRRRRASPSAQRAKKKYRTNSKEKHAAYMRAYRASKRVAS